MSLNSLLRKVAGSSATVHAAGHEAARLDDLLGVGVRDRRRQNALGGKRRRLVFLSSAEKKTLIAGAIALMVGAIIYRFGRAATLRF
jgi:hypothetical protein